MCFRLINDTFSPRKQYVYEFQIIRQTGFIELTLFIAYAFHRMNMRDEETWNNQDNQTND